MNVTDDKIITVEDIKKALDGSSVKNKDITLRDYFAGQIAPGIIQGLMMRAHENGYSDEGAIAETIRLSRMYADAMISRRDE